MKDAAIAIAYGIAGALIVTLAVKKVPAVAKVLG